jgi:DNA repair protein RadC
VARRSLELGAASIILVHNHPSGDPAPSAADVAITREVQAAAKAIGVTVHDHLIIGRGGAASFKTLGLL